MDWCSPPCRLQNPDKHRSRLAKLTRTPAVLPISALSEVADIVIECAPSKLVRSIVAPFVASGKTAVVSQRRCAA